MEQQPSLCVLRLSALGDCINAFGLLGGLKRTYPQLELCWIIDQRFAPLFCDEHGHDLIPLIRLNFKQSLFKVHSDLKQALKDKQEPFTALLNLQTSLKASICSLAIKTPHKYGYDAQRSREGQRLFVNEIVPSPENPHVLAGFMAFAAACGYPIAEPVWDFQLDPYVIDKARCVVAHEKVFALCPCSAVASKNWTTEGYIKLTQYAQSKGMCVVLLGGNSALEREVCNTIEQECQHEGQLINLCGKTSLRELAGFLSVAKLVVSPDSGSMHLAAALGTPVIGLFARHDEQRVGPWNFMDLNVSVYHKLAQQELKGRPVPWRYRVRTPDAMSKISVEQVLNAFDRALARYRI